MKNRKKFIVAIDQGTTSSRAILFNTAGVPVFKSQLEDLGLQVMQAPMGSASPDSKFKLVPGAPVLGDGPHGGLLALGLLALALALRHDKTLASRPPLTP